MTLSTARAATLAALGTADAEYARRLTTATADALVDAGFARHFVPKRWGGDAGSFTEAAEAAATLAEACASTAWCAALYAAHARLAAHLPEEGQAELWAAGPDVRIAAAVVPPAGQATAAPGGWVLHGTWRLASGVDHAHWVLLASPAGTGEDRGSRIFAVPREDVEILDTWRSLGLRGTGSNGVRVERAFVPAHRTFTVADLDRPGSGRDRCHAVPHLMVAGAQFVAPALGAARAALRDWHDLFTARTGTDGTSVSGTPGRSLAAARASADLHAAGLVLRHALHRADAGDVTPLAVSENVRDFARVAELCAAATDLLMRTAGSRALAEDSPLQRRWRDVLAATGHAALGMDAASVHYAGALAARGLDANGAER
ncbi:acyl-CoA dehydrogenase family protein [Streptomyces sp. NPDC048603]|uniref:acyl-CoA dehydrogenase family protein n=1 Tax=Streptomyces sp. NPDC048603 TaxID=3365577 RepID=UPI00371A52FA